MTNTDITIHIKGFCIGSRGFGGWAAIVCHYEDGRETKKRRMSGSAAFTTSSEMELKAALEGLKAIEPGDTALVTVRSQGQYIAKGMNEWIENWQANGWRTSGRKPVEHMDRWKELLSVSSGLSTRWEWERAHSGDKQSREAFALAQNAAIRGAQECV